MLQNLHKNSKTNYFLRQKIKESSEPIIVLSNRYHLSWLTVKKWKSRDSLEDKSSRPHKLRTTLTTDQENLILLERKLFKKSIREIYLTLEKQIPNLYPMKIYRCISRYGLAVLPMESPDTKKQIKRHMSPQAKKI